MYSRAQQMQRQLDFLAQFGIRGDFFVIPKTGDHTLDEDKDLVPILKKAMADNNAKLPVGALDDKLWLDYAKKHPAEESEGFTGSK